MPKSGPKPKKRRNFTAELSSVSMDGSGRRAAPIAVTLRHVVYDDTPHTGLQQHIISIYRMMWEFWPDDYVTDDGVLLLPPVDVLTQASREHGENDNDIQSSLEKWCQCYPNVDDERVLEIAANVRGDGERPQYTLTPEDMHYLAKVFLEAHVGR